MYKKYYKTISEKNPGVQHYLAHEHHYMPDAAIDAIAEYEIDSAKHSIHLQNFIQTHKVPQAQKLIAKKLKLSSSQKIIFASNTQDVIGRLTNSFSSSKPIKVLTTDSEEYSFENHLGVEIEKVSTSPFDDFETHFISKIKNNFFDIIFFSNVFFNSGMAVKNLKSIVEAVVDKKTMIVIDGRFSFMALPTDLSEIETRAFYLGSSSHFAQAGSGCSFLCPPKDNYWNQIFEGWATDSSTDYSALYRLTAVLNLFDNAHLTVEKVHQYIQKLQQNFREHLLMIDHHYLTEKNILSIDYNYHGHFLTFAMPSTEHAQKLCRELENHKIITDFRGNKLRFGFGLYQDECIDLSSLRMN